MSTISEDPNQRSVDPRSNAISIAAQILYDWLVQNFAELSMSPPDSDKPSPGEPKRNISDDRK